MSKELEALKRIRKAPTSYREEKPRFTHTYFQDLDIVETALKNLNTIKECVSFNSSGDLVLTQHGKVHYDLLREVLR